jgi:hypothetical protein
MEKFITWLNMQIEEINLRIERGKGIWPQSDYIKDEHWARMLERKHVLDDVRYMLTKLTAPSE